MTDEAAAAAIDGMNRATDHANRETYLWETAAMAYLKLYIATRAKHGEHFLTEDVRLAAREAKALDDPPDDRAWGRPIKKASKLGLVEPVMDSAGNRVTRPSKTGHKRLMQLWRWTGATLD